MIPCPAVLLRHDQTKYTESFKNNPAVAFETEGGWTLGRPRNRRRSPMLFNLGFVGITDAQKKEVEKAYRDAHGSAVILQNWSRPVSDELINVRFAFGFVPQFSYVGRGETHLWDVQIKLEQA